MPRHMQPDVGTLVWYFAAPGKRPQAAIVDKRVTQTSFNLTVLQGQDGVATPQLGIPFLENPGLKPASGEYCTPTGIQDDIDGAGNVQSGTSHVSAAAVAAGGTGYVIADTITLSNGVVLTVATINAGAVLTVTITNPGSATLSAEPANPRPQVSTSGVGTGATFNLTWIPD